MPLLGVPPAPIRAPRARLLLPGQDEARQRRPGLSEASREGSELLCGDSLPKRQAGNTSRELQQIAYKCRPTCSSGRRPWQRLRYDPVPQPSRPIAAPQPGERAASQRFGHLLTADFQSQHRWLGGSCLTPASGGSPGWHGPMQVLRSSSPEPSAPSGHVPLPPCLGFPVGLGCSLPWRCRAVLSSSWGVGAPKGGQPARAGASAHRWQPARHKPVFTPPGALARRRLRRLRGARRALAQPCRHPLCQHAGHRDSPAPFTGDLGPARTPALPSRVALQTDTALPDTSRRGGKYPNTPGTCRASPGGS